MDADAVEIRVLGCLIEKQRTTPDAYPLSLNSLRLACNQTTNRDPVVDYDESVVREALERLSRKRWVRLASGRGSRAAKYRHLFDEAIGVSGEELSVLAVLMLRGPQTPGELKQRTERLHAFPSLDAVNRTLEELIERELVVRLPRAPGQKEMRFEQLLGASAQPVATEAVVDAVESADRLGVLEERITRLERTLAALLDRLGEPRATETTPSGTRDAFAVGDDLFPTTSAADDVERAVPGAQ